MKIVSLIICSLLLLSCSESKSQKSVLNKESKDQLANSFLTAYAVVERSNILLQTDIDNTLGSFNSKRATLMATRAAKEQVDGLNDIATKAEYIHFRSKNLQNELVLICDQLIKLSDDANYGKVKPNDPKGNRHYYIINSWQDASATYELLSLNRLENLLDLETSSKLLVGDIESPKGSYLVDSLVQFRNLLCESIGTYTDYRGNDYSFSGDIQQLKSNSQEDIAQYMSRVRVNLKTASARDTATLIEIYHLLSKPENVISSNGSKPWLTSNFHNATLVSSLVLLNAIKNEVILAEHKAISHLAAQLMVPNFYFNKIEAFTLSDNNIAEEDSLEIFNGIVAYDSTEKFRIRYWIDDASKNSKKHEFISSKVGPNKIPINNKTSGMHTIYGETNVRERGQTIWKSWEYSYFVP
jgi:hypothetical protein